MCKGSRGLLTKIVDVMKKEPTASTFRFWLARAVESHLRGTTSYCDQIFLLRRGLLQVGATTVVSYLIRLTVLGMTLNCRQRSLFNRCAHAATWVLSP